MNLRIIPRFLTHTLDSRKTLQYGVKQTPKISDEPNRKVKRFMWLICGMTVWQVVSLWGFTIIWQRWERFHIKTCCQISKWISPHYCKDNMTQMCMAGMAHNQNVILCAFSHLYLPNEKQISHSLILRLPSLPLALCEHQHPTSVLQNLCIYISSSKTYVFH